eukprot:4744393-Pyramimonas_sp.AAC.1
MDCTSRVQYPTCWVNASMRDLQHPHIQSTSARRMLLLHRADGRGSHTALAGMVRCDHQGGRQCRVRK